MAGTSLLDITAGFADRHRFFCPTEIVFGAGVSGELAARVAATGRRRVLVVADPLATAGRVRGLAQLRAEPGLDVRIWHTPPGEPTVEGVTPGGHLAVAERPDLVVAFGGGSTIDTAKVLAVLAAAPAGVGVTDVLDTGSYRIEDAAELWAVPTISGTGAEVTRGTVVADNAGVKHGFASRARHPRLALLDPDLALGIPSRVLGPPTADLFCHAVESFTTRGGFPTGDVLAATAITLLGGVLDEDGPWRSRHATGRAMMAAVYAAQAFSSGSGLTLAHEFSDVAGLPLGLPHGYAAALLLPAVLRCGAGTGADRVRRLGGLFGDLGWRGDPVADAVWALRRTGAPRIRDACDVRTALALVHTLYEVGDPRHSVPRDEAVAVVEAAFDSDD